MDVTVLYVDACPHASLATDRIATALDRVGIDAQVLEQLVESEEQADAIGFTGSPTLLVDGRDPFSTAPSGMSCRLYSTEEGTQGAPSVNQLVNALRR
jgi:hypothetical protein